MTAPGTTRRALASAGVALAARLAAQVAGAGPAGAALRVAAVGLSGCATQTGRVATAPLPPEKSAHIVLTAMAFLDVPYRRGGNGGAATRDAAADGFDCSGFTRHVYERSLGLTLPRTAWDQARAPSLAEVRATDLQPGDLLFFNTLQRAHSHVGIYVGDGRFIHAPRPGTRVRLEELTGPAGRYWTQRFDGARRPAAGLP